MNVKFEEDTALFFEANYDNRLLSILYTVVNDIGMTLAELGRSEPSSSSSRYLHCR